MLSGLEGLKGLTILPLTARKLIAWSIEQRTAMSEVQGSNPGRNILVTISNVLSNHTQYVWLYHLTF